MTNCDRDVAAQITSALGNGNGPDAMTAAEDLAALLNLGDVGLIITGARIVGNGSRASADIYLSNGETMFFESLRDFGTARTLSLEVVSQAGAVPKLRQQDAMRALALLRALAERQATASEDDVVRDFGREYLRIAPTSDPFAMGAQDWRWQGFYELSACKPDEDAEGLGGRLGSYAYASNTLVLLDTDGTRYVRAGWFRSYVRREVGGLYSPAALAAHMERVGWTRPGREGLIKATSPDSRQTLAWRFYVVAKDWA